MLSELRVRLRYGLCTSVPRHRGHDLRRAPRPNHPVRRCARFSCSVAPGTGMGDCGGHAALGTRSGRSSGVRSRRAPSPARWLGAVVPADYAAGRRPGSSAGRQDEPACGNNLGRTHRGGAVRWIARLGGFLGRRRDGEPGVQVLWRGFQSATGGSRAGDGMCRRIAADGTSEGASVHGHGQARWYPVIHGDGRCATSARLPGGDHRPW